MILSCSLAFLLIVPALVMAACNGNGICEDGENMFCEDRTSAYCGDGTCDTGRIRARSGDSDVFWKIVGIA